MNHLVNQLQAIASAYLEVKVKFICWALLLVGLTFNGQAQVLLPPSSNAPQMNFALTSKYALAITCS